MNNVTRMPLASPPPLERTAEAVAEIKELYAAYEEATKQNERDNRVIQQLQDRLKLTEEALQEERASRRVCERKLIRLAANQKNISRIAQDGDEIMRSIQEWTEDEQAGADVEAGVRDILSRVHPKEQTTEDRALPPNTP